jgi:hypothetical protein
VATVNQVREAMHRVPFRPFALRLADGESKPARPSVHGRRGLPIPSTRMVLPQPDWCNRLTFKELRCTPDLSTIVEAGLVTGQEAPSR